MATKATDNVVPLIWVSCNHSFLITMEGNTRNWPSNYNERRYYEGDAPPNYPMPALASSTMVLCHAYLNGLSLETGPYAWDGVWQSYEDIIQYAPKYSTRYWF